MRRLRALARFVPDCTRLFTRLARDERTPRTLAIGLVAIGAYLASPIDLIPDFIPVVGYLDDAVVLVLALRWALRRAGPELVSEHWPGPPSSLNALLRLLAPRTEEANV